MGSGRISFFLFFNGVFTAPGGEILFRLCMLTQADVFWPGHIAPTQIRPSSFFFFSELFSPFPILSGNYSPCCFSAFSSSSPSPQSLFPRWKKNFCTLTFPSLKTMESAGNNFVLYAGNLFLRRANIIIVSIMTHCFRLPRKIWREKKMRRGNKQHSSNHLE